MIIERNGNIEPELGEVYHIDVDIQVFGNSRGNVESDLFEKNIQAIISIFDPVKLSIDSLFDDGSPLLLGIVNINLPLSDRLLGENGRFSQFLGSYGQPGIVGLLEVLLVPNHYQ